MPIRMTDDPQEQDQYHDDQGGGGRSNFPGSGGSGGLISLLPLLFSLFKGKGIVVLIALAVGAYFFVGKSGGGCNMSQIAQLATGGFLDPQQFKKAAIYEPVSGEDPKNPPLPEAVNLQQFAPPVGNQGQQGSCVAWSSAYAARTILESSRTGVQAEQLKFSPAFLYNQIGLDGCQGSYIIRAMEFMTKQGSVPYDQFEYTDQDCTRQPEGNLQQLAQQYKMRGFNRLTAGDNTEVLDLYAIKQHLAQGAPVVIGMMVGQSFMQNMIEQDVWQPEVEDRNMVGFGGHAMCVVGYDDKKYGGSFLIMNSWGPQWGNNGFGWVRYGDFKYYVREAYGLDPMQKVGAAANVPLACEIGLMQVAVENNKTVVKGNIPLRFATGNRFETITPVTIGSRFKVEIKNSSECYIYVFGKETDGTAYTLFPYPTKEDPSKTRYSPFCGITGYRLFPKDKSMTPDSIGNKDEIAVVISKEALDWNTISRQLSQNPQSDFNYRLNTILSSILIQNVQFQSSGKGAMKFQVNNNTGKVVAAVVSISKQ